MSDKLERMLDYEKFSKNDKIEKMVGDLDERYGKQLNEDDLEHVAAAGNPERKIVLLSGRDI